ncbi:MAG: phycobilisome rod-core linker polypeptide, partial [Cyanobacteria bacterium J06631_2]
VTMFGNYQQPQPNQHPYGVGNDPIETQFGAIFPSETRNFYIQPVAFGKNNRRLLIDSGMGMRNVNNISSKPHLTQSQSNNENRQRNINLSNHSVEVIMKGAYRQVFGCEPFSGQHLSVAETKLRNNEIDVREFVRQLAKSSLFRNLYWDNLYITKAIAAIHRRLLGRPTYGRSEMNQYYDLCSKKGFYALVDAILDSGEYLEAFGENTVPYERYLTPKGWARRSLAQPDWSQAQLDPRATAGEVVAQKIREDKERLAKLTSASNGNGHVPEEIEEATETAFYAVDENKESIADINSDPAEPELLDIEVEAQAEENYEYS